MARWRGRVHPFQDPELRMLGTPYDSCGGTIGIHRRQSWSASSSFFFASQRHCMEARGESKILLGMIEKDEILDMPIIGLTTTLALAEP